MSIFSYRKTLLALVTITLISRTVYRFLQWRKNKESKPKQINEVITFSETTKLIPSKYSYKSSKVSPSVERVLYYLNKAQYSLDICMYMFSNRDISYTIQKLHFKGVKIRYISDANTAYENKSVTKRLFKNDAISLRCKRSENIMHHKFCIIDGRADVRENGVLPFIMTGSLNWTNQALNGNWDSVVVMSEPRIVQLYKDEFEKLWRQFALPVNTRTVL